MRPLLDDPANRYYRFAHRFGNGADEDVLSSETNSTAEEKQMEQVASIDTSIDTSIDDGKITDVLIVVDDQPLRDHPPT